jgi:lipoyl(octanoyl) transferase
MKLSNLRFFSDADARSAAENMALDEALFLQTSFPIMRSYRWMRPSISFGYFTPWKSVPARFVERDLVRRWTGGGIVEHGDDFTYSVIFHDQPLATNAEIYRFVHCALADLLRRCGYPVEISESAEPLETNVCFQRAVEFDLKLGGEKIAGAAIRRNRRGILLQGSIQRIEIPSYFTAKFADALGKRSERLTLSKPIMETAERLAREKYGAAEWTRRF